MSACEGSTAASSNACAELSTYSAHVSNSDAKRLPCALGLARGGGEPPRRGQHLNRDPASREPIDRRGVGLATGLARRFRSAAARAARRGPRRGPRSRARAVAAATSAELWAKSTPQMEKPCKSRDCTSDPPPLRSSVFALDSRGSGSEIELLSNTDTGDSARPVGSCRSFLPAAAPATAQAPNTRLTTLATGHRMRAHGPERAE